MAGLLSGVGVLNGGAVTGSTSGPNMQYNIAAGVFVTARGSAATDGLYLFANDGSVTQDSGSPSPSSGTRWDLIWVRALNAYDGGFGDTSSKPVFGVTVGTVGSSPTKPYASVPAGALVLAESNVGTNIANASLATISNVAAQTTMAGTFQSAAARVTNSSTQYTVSTTPLAVNSYSGGVLFNSGNITYAGGIFTAPPGLYVWHASVLWPAASSAYRVTQYALVNGATDSGGEASMNFASGYGSQWLSSSHVIQLTATGTIQLGLVGSTNGIAGTTPLSFAIHRIG